MNWIEILPWQVWVLISGVASALSQVIGKKQVHRMTAAQMGLIRDLSGFGIALVVWIILGAREWNYLMLAPIINGMLFAGGMALYFRAVRGSLSGTSVFGYLLSQVMIVISSAIIFSEWVYFDPRTWRGSGNLIVLVVTLGAMLTYVKSLKLGKKWSGLLLVSAVVNVIGNLVAKYFVSGRMQVWDYFFLEDLGLVMGGIMILWVRGQDLRVGWERIRLGIVQGVIDVMGPLIYLQILATQPLSLASLVRRLVAIGLTSGMGLWWYREREGMGKRAWISLSLAVVAFTLVMWVNR